MCLLNRVNALCFISFLRYHVNVIFSTKIEFSANSLVGLYTFETRSASISNLNVSTDLKVCFGKIETQSAILQSALCD